MKMCRPQSRRDVAEALSCVRPNMYGSPLERAAWARQQSRLAYAQLTSGVRMPKRTPLPAETEVAEVAEVQAPVVVTTVGSFHVQFLTGETIVEDLACTNYTTPAKLFGAVAAALGEPVARVRLFCGATELQPPSNARYQLRDAVSRELDSMVIEVGATGLAHVTLTCIVDKGLIGTFRDLIARGRHNDLAAMLSYNAPSHTLLLSTNRGNATIDCVGGAPKRTRFSPVMSGPSVFFDGTGNLFATRMTTRQLVATDGRQAMHTLNLHACVKTFCVVNHRMFVSFENDKTINVYTGTTRTGRIGPLKSAPCTMRAVGDTLVVATRYSQHVYVIRCAPGKHPLMVRKLNPISLSDYGYAKFKTKLDMKGQGMCVTADGAQVVCRVPHENILVVRDVADGRVRAELRTPPEDTLQCLDRQPCDGFVLALTTTGKVAVWVRPWTRDAQMPPSALLPCPALTTTDKYMHQCVPARPVALASMEHGRVAVVYTDGSLHIMVIKC